MTSTMHPAAGPDQNPWSAGPPLAPRSEGPTGPPFVDDPYATAPIPLTPLNPPAGPSSPVTSPPNQPPTRPAAKSGGGGGWRAGLVGGVVGALVAGGVAYGTVRLTDKPAAAPTAVATTATTGASSRPAESGASALAGPALDIHTLVDRVAPSVVDIEIGQQVGGGVRQVAAGSGVVISGDGLVLTNAHVVDLTDQFGRRLANAVIIVKSADGKERNATVLGADPSHDIALVRVADTSGLTAATLGSSAALRVGDDVVAIGNALDLGDTPSVTRGIVSALDRSLDVDASTTLTGLIQTDAPINHGNSGGALVNARVR